MKQTKFIRHKNVWFRVFAIIGLSLFAVLPGKAQLIPPDDFRLKVKFDQQTKFQVALFSPDDLGKLSVLDKMSLSKSSESSTVEMYYLKDDRITTHTTFLQKPEKSWMPFVKYSVLDGRTVQLYNEQGKLLQEMDMGKEFEAYTKMASALVSDEGSFRYPTAYEYEGLVQHYESEGFSVTDLGEGKLWIESQKTQIEMDLTNKTQTHFSKDDQGLLKRIQTKQYLTLTSGKDVPVFTETIEYDHFPNGICFQNIRTDRFLNYEIVKPEVEERAGTPVSGSVVKCSVAPNPVENRLYVQGVPLSDAPIWYTISDLTGNVCRTVSIAPQALSAGINVADLHPGIYLFSMGLQDQVQTIKFVKL